MALRATMVDSADPPSESAPGVDPTGPPEAMRTSYGWRSGSLALSPPGTRVPSKDSSPAAFGRVRRAIRGAERWYGPAALVALFAYPNPLVPFALLAIGISFAGRIRMVGTGVLARAPAPALDAAFTLLLAGSAIGLALSHDADAAGLRITGTVAAIAVYYLLLGRIDSESALRRSTLGLCALIGGGVVAVLALLRGQLPNSALSRGLSPILALFADLPGVSGDVLDVNARFAVHQYGLAHLLLLAAAFGVSAATFGLSRRARVLGGLAAAAAVPLLLATQSRGAMLALALAASVVAGQRTRWAWAIFPLSAAGFIALLVRGTVSRSIEADWLHDRVAYWTGTLGILGDFPLLGAGLGMRTFADVFAWYHGLPGPYLVTHTHNVVLQAYAEQGLAGAIGLVIVLAVGVAIALRATRNTPPRIRWEVGGAAGGLLGSAIYGMTDQVPTTNIGFALLCGLLAIAVAGDRLVGDRHAQPTRPHDLTPLSPTPRLAAMIGLVLVGGTILLAPRWLSGARLNLGSADLIAAALERSGDAVARADQLERAERNLETATRWNPNNVAASRNLAWARLLRHDVAGAHEAIAAADRVDLPPFERGQLARLARAAGLIDRAIALLRQDGDEAQLREVAGQMWSQRRWADAAAAYAALTELNPDEAEYISNTAIAVLNGGGDAEAAMVLLRDAVAKNPGAARNLARQLVLRGEPCRADERRGGGRFECAAFWFGLASRVDPTYDRPEVELGSILYYRGRYEEAAAHFAEASHRDPRNPSTYSQLGDSYVKLGRVEEAVGYFERGVQARPDRADLHANLGRAYLLAGRRDDARRALQTATSLAPTNPAYREELERLEAGG